MLCDYYEKLSSKTMDKLEQLNNDDPMAFYSDSGEFKLSFYLAYFLLAMESIVSVDKNNLDINTRYTLNIDGDLLDSFMSHFSNKIIIEDAEEEYSHAWFLSALRNALAHSQVIDVDFENECIVVDNDHKLNKLKATIPLSFFKFFTELNIASLVHLSKDNPFNIISPDNHAREYLFQHKKESYTEENIETFLSLLDRVNIQVTSESSSNITYDEALEMLKHAKFIAEEVMDEKCGDIGFEAICHQLDRLEEYDLPPYVEYRYIYLFLYIELFTELLHESNPTISVNAKFDKMLDQDTMDTLINKKKILEKSFYDQFKYLLDFKKELNFVNNSSFIYGILEFINNYEASLNTINNCRKYLSEEELREVFINPDNVIEKLLNSIREKRNSAGCEDNVYDLSLLRKIYKSVLEDDVSFFEEDADVFDEIAKPICKSMRFSEHVDVKSYKDKYSSFFDKYTKRMSEDDYSDGVLKVCLCKYNIYDLFRHFETMKYGKEWFMVCLLYTIGINLYVFNKESVFDYDDNSNYDFMNDLNIEAYSSQSYSDYEGNRRRLNSLIKDRDFKVGSYDRCSKNSYFPRERLIEFSDEIDNIKIEIFELNNSISKTSIKEIEGKNLASDYDNMRIANVIRNCLAHHGRIIITDINDKNVLVQLTDYNDKGEVTSCIETDISSLMEFVNNDIFHRMMSDRYDDSVTYKKTI